MRKVQLASAIPSTTLVTPATPPAETDEDVETTQTTPTAAALVPNPLPPVTPSKHIASGTAKATAIAPPGQPRKTPQAKRVAVDSDSDEIDDVLPALGVTPVSRPKVKASKVAGKVTSSESRPTRVTRSTAGAAAIRKAGTTASNLESPMKATRQGPNKIPRLASTRTTSAAKAAVAAAPPTRRIPPPPPPSPTPSRLPTLVPTRRPHHAPSNSLTDVTTLKRPGTALDAWMTNNASAVVVPATKSARPGLRSVRRRRSSFSSADVFA